MASEPPPPTSGSQDTDGFVLDETRPVGVQVLQWLRNAIVRMALRPGQPVSENEIAARLGVSRQPVREAFIRLKETGLMRVVPQRGSFVAGISVDAVKTAQFIRSALETAIVEEAARHRPTDSVTALRDSLARQCTARARGDADRFYGEDERFHHLLALAAGREPAWRVIEDSKAQMDRVRYLSFDRATPTEILIHQHTRIVAAVADGDGPAAAATMRDHLALILESLPRLAAQYPQFFETGPPRAPAARPRGSVADATGGGHNRTHDSPTVRAPENDKPPTLEEIA